MPRYRALPVTSMTDRVVPCSHLQIQTRRSTLATSTVRHRPAHRYRYVDPADGSGGGKGFVGGGSGDGSGTGVSGGIGSGSGSGGCDTGVIDVMRAGSAPRELCRAGPGSRLCPWAGDEFAVLAPKTAPDAARTLATRLLDQMAQQVSTNRIDRSRVVRSCPDCVSHRGLVHA